MMNQPIYKTPNPIFRRIRFGLSGVLNHLGNGLFGKAPSAGPRKATNAK
jgi:hypothetical protein